MSISVPVLHSFVYVLSEAAFELQQPSGVVVTETIWSTEPKIFAIWPFKKEFADGPGLGE